MRGAGASAGPQSKNNWLPAGYCTAPRAPAPQGAGMPADEMTGQCLRDPCRWLAAINAARSVQEPVNVPVHSLSGWVPWSWPLLLVVAFAWLSLRLSASDLLPLGSEASWVVQIYTTAAQGCCLERPAADLFRDGCYQDRGGAPVFFWVFVSFRLIPLRFQSRPRES